MCLRSLTLVCGWIVLHAPTDAQQSSVPEIPCTRYTQVLCTYDLLNFSSNAIRQLRALQPLNFSFNVVQVERLISVRPDGELLQLLSYFTERIYYTSYYETILHIPAACELKELEVQSATQLQMVAVSGLNRHLTVLVISRAVMRRIPHSLQNLLTLTHFIANRGQLEVVNLEAFRNIKNLVSVSLRENKVRVLEISTDPELNVAAQDLILSYNELEFIDMEFFVPLRRLQFVDLYNNRLKQIVVPEGKLISLPTVSAILFSGNQLTQLNVTGWIAPKLRSIELESNNLTRLPIGLDRLERLQILQMRDNQLTTVDLGRFARCREMVRIDLSSNMLRTILPAPHAGHTSPPRIYLPNLTVLELTYNNLNNVNYELWDFPKLSTLLLSYNRIQRVPRLNLLPGLQRTLLNGNPLLCSSLRSLESEIESYQLRVNEANRIRPCTTSSSFSLSSGRVVCCDE